MTETDTSTTNATATEVSEPLPELTIESNPHVHRDPYLHVDMSELQVQQAEYDRLVDRYSHAGTVISEQRRQITIHRDLSAQHLASFQCEHELRMKYIEMSRQIMSNWGSALVDKLTGMRNSKKYLSMVASQCSKGADDFLDHYSGETLTRLFAQCKALDYPEEITVTGAETKECGHCCNGEGCGHCSSCEMEQLRNDLQEAVNSAQSILEQA